MALLEVNNLRIRFRDEYGLDFEAVKGVSFSLERGQTLAVVGESGSGKSVTALALTRLLPQPPAVYEDGQVTLDGENVASLDGDGLKAIRGARIAYVFQEPGTSLNPVFSVGTQIGEVIRLHRDDVEDVDAEAVWWLNRVGIVDPEKRLNAYPHELSGGMQQRVMIAMALAGRPDVLVADEPTTALDVTVQKQVMALLKSLQEEFGMAVLLITHNFGIIRGIAHRVAVMFRGEIVEEGAAATVLDEPSHPYTKALIECIPRLGQSRERLTTIDHDAIAATLRDSGDCG